MRSSSNARKLITNLPNDLDLQALGPVDLLNVVLQRSDVLSEVGAPQHVIRSWVDGDSAPLQEVVTACGVELAQIAFHIIADEFEQMTPTLDQISPKNMADIGCGYGFLGLLMHQRYDCDLMLIDTEVSQHRHFGFREEASAYTSLSVAQQFLVDNGMAKNRITTWNPETSEDMEHAENFDLAVSFLCCGYHFPVDLYLPFFRYAVNPKGGSVMLDVRSNQMRDAKQKLRKLGRLSVVSRLGDHQRLLLTRGAA